MGLALVLASIYAFELLWPRGGIQANPFDPAGYIQEQEAKRAEVPEKLTTRAIYRIDGKRFQRFNSGSGGALFPSAGEVPEVREALLLCPSHLPLMTEVLPIRQNLPIPPELKPLEPNILAMIALCRDGKVTGPAKTVEARDGAVVTITPTATDRDYERKGVEGETSPSSEGPPQKRLVKPGVKVKATAP